METNTISLREETNSEMFERIFSSPEPKKAEKPAAQVASLVVDPVEDVKDEGHTEKASLQEEEQYNEVELALIPRPRKVNQKELKKDNEKRAFLAANPTPFQTSRWDPPRLYLRGKLIYTPGQHQMYPKGVSVMKGESQTKNNAPPDTKFTAEINCPQASTTPE